MNLNSFLNNYFVRKTLQVLETTSDILMLPEAENDSFQDSVYSSRIAFSAGVLVITGSSLGTGFLLRNTKVGFVGGTLIIPALVGGVLVYRRATDMATTQPLILFTPLGFAL